MIADCTTLCIPGDPPKTIAEERKEQYQKVLSRIVRSPYHAITPREESLLQSMCEEYPLSPKELEQIDVIWPRLSRETKEYIYGDLPFDFQIALFNTFSEGFQISMLPSMRDCLMRFERNERATILQKADDRIVRYFYSHVSFLDDNNLKGISFDKAEGRLLPVQKELLLRLIVLDHPETVAEVQQSELLRYLVCRELECYMERSGPFPAEYTIYNTLKRIDSLCDYVLPKEFLRILMFMRTGRDLLSAGIIGQSSDVGLEFRKIKKMHSGLPFTIEYNCKDQRAIVRLAPLDKGMYKAVKKCLWLLKEGILPVAVSKQKIVTSEQYWLAQNELAIWATVKHLPNMLPLYQAIVYPSKKTCSNVVRTVSPLCNMGKLTAWLAPGKLTPLEKLQIALSVVQSVVALHGESILHRDIKPDNIYLHEVLKEGKRTIRVFMADFGLSCRYDQPWRDRMFGSALYMHPAVLQGSKKSDYSADVWGIGATFYYMFKEQLFFGEFGALEDLIEAGFDLGDLTKNPRPADEQSIDFVIWKMMQPDDTQQMTLVEATHKIESLL